MDIFISGSSATVYYHGTKSRFSKFSEYRPAFFTMNKAYAEQYGHIILEVQLSVRHWFDTRKDARAVKIYNELFLTSGLARAGAKEIKLGHPVPMSEADELWSFLAVPEYPGQPYDGIIVSESNVSRISKDLKGADLSYVPIDVSQIKIVKK